MPDAAPPAPSPILRALRIAAGLALVALAAWLLIHDARADGKLDTLTAWVALVAGGFGGFLLDPDDVKAFGAMLVGWVKGAHE